MNSIFNLEQQILNTWNIIDDLRNLREMLDSEQFVGMDSTHTDKIDNYVLSLITLYEVKFDKTFRLFEQVCSEYHEANRRAIATASKL